MEFSLETYAHADGGSFGFRIRQDGRVCYDAPHLPGGAGFTPMTEAEAQAHGVQMLGVYQQAVQEGA